MTRIVIVIFWAVVGLSHAAEPPLISSGGNAYKQVGPGGVNTLLVSLSHDSAHVTCMVTSEANELAVYRMGVSAPIFRESQLPGYSLTKPSSVPSVPSTTQMGCYDDGKGATGIYAVVFNTKDGKASIAHISPKGDVSIPLQPGTAVKDPVSFVPENESTTLKGLDPVSGKEITFGVLELNAGSIEVRNGKAIVFAVLAPLPPTLTTRSEVAFVKIDPSGKKEMLYNSNVKRNENNRFSQMYWYLVSNCLYFTGRPAVNPPSNPSAVRLYMVVGDQAVMVKDYFVPFKQMLGWLENGVQVYSTSGTTHTYSYLPDNSTPVGSGATGEQVIFTGSSAAGVTLSSGDTMFASGPRSLDLITQDKQNWVRFSDGVAKLMKTSAMAPTGSILSVVTDGAKTILLQKEGSENRVYQVYTPALDRAEYSAQVGGNGVTITGKDYALAGTPSLTCTIGGKAIQLSLVFAGDRLTVAVPYGISPGKAECNVLVATSPVMALPFTLNILPSAGPPPPIVRSVVSGASFKEGMLTPGLIGTVFFADNTGKKEQPSTFPSYVVGGVTIVVDGTKVPIFYNSGSGQANFYLPPSTVLGKTEVGVVVSVDGVASASYKARVATTSQDSLFSWYEDGKLLGVILHSNYDLVTKNNPALPGETLVGYGTGCRVNPQPPNDMAVGEVLYSATSPMILVGGVKASVVFAGMIPGFAGLCQYNFEVPKDTSGDVPVSFAGVDGLQLFLRVQ